VLPGGAEVAVGSARTDVQRVAACQPVVIIDFESKSVVGGVKQKTTYAGHAFDAVDAVAVQCNVKCVGIFSHDFNGAFSSFFGVF